MIVQIKHGFTQRLVLTNKMATWKLAIHFDYCIITMQYNYAYVLSHQNVLVQ